MGSLMGKDYPHMIYLFSSFIGQELGMGNKFLDERKINTITNVCCPFCDTGSLKLSRVKANYSGGANPLPPTKHHVGNSYEFRCSNEECDARFFGSYTWMHID